MGAKKMKYCSILFHLAKFGWKETVLLERDELTSGSTWHAAAQVTQFGGNQTMIALKQHSIRLYRELAADPDQEKSSQADAFAGKDTSV